jgi:large subunit ribosomal protein L16
MSITAKPIAVRMGGGKGSPDHYVALMRKGQVIFDVDGEADGAVIKDAIAAASKKLGCATRIIEMGVFY